MILSSFGIFLILVACSATVNGDSKFPSTVPRCKYADVKCLQNVINTLIKSSSSGIPDIDLASIDPMFIGKTVVEQGAASSPVNLKIQMKNTYLHGAKHFVVDKVVGFEKDPKKSRFEIYGSCPRSTVIGTYQVTGKVLLLPVNGHGQANISLYDNKIKMQLVTHVENRNGAEYLIIDNILYDSDAKRMTLNFDNLFNDVVLSESMNSFFNENQDILYKKSNECNIR